MRSRVRFASIVVVVGLVAVGATRVSSEDKVDAAAPKEQEISAPTSASLRRLLSERVDIPPEFKGVKIPFRTVLAYLSDTAHTRKERLPFLFDKAAFAEANLLIADLAEQEVDVPAFVRSMTNRQVLEMTLPQIQGDPTYLVRDGLIVFVPREAAKLERLLDRTIAVDFRDLTLNAAFAELSDRSGVGIAVDPRCDESSKKKVTLQAEQGMTVRGVLESIADMNDLKIVVTAQRVTVLPQSIYLKRLADQAAEAKLRREIDLDPAILEGPRLEPMANRNP
jgi:hypothetical protein